MKSFFSYLSPANWLSPGLSAPAPPAQARLAGITPRPAGTVATAQQAAPVRQSTTAQATTKAEPSPPAASPSSASRPASSTQASQTPPGSAPPGAASPTGPQAGKPSQGSKPPAPGARRGRPPRKKWVSGTALFYAASAVCHVACVVLLMTAPFGTRMRRPLKPPPIQAEETEEVENPRFNLPRPATLAAVSAQGQGDGFAPPDDPAANDSAAGDTYRPGTGQPPGEMLPVDIDTVGAARAAEKAIGAGLDWFARHQEPDGHWSLSAFDQHCRGEHCDQPGAANNDAAATGLALVPFFGTGTLRPSPARIPKRSIELCAGSSNISIPVAICRLEPRGGCTRTPSPRWPCAKISH